MRKLSLFLLLTTAFGLIGCGSGAQVEVKKNEEEGYRNPSKVPPPEAGNIGGAPK